MFVKRSVTTSDEKRKKQIHASTSNAKKMIINLKTRRNSCFYMLERFVELAPILSEVCTLPRSTFYGYCLRDGQTQESDYAIKVL